MSLVRTEPNHRRVRGFVDGVAHKVVAEYFSMATSGGTVVPDIAWVYPAPIPQIPTITNHVAFFNEHVDITVDGQPEQRPTTKWS